MTMFCHENVIVSNSGLHDESLHFTGQPEVYKVRADAQIRVDYLNAKGADIEIFEFIESDW